MAVLNSLASALLEHVKLPEFGRRLQFIENALPFLGKAT